MKNRVDRCRKKTYDPFVGPKKQEQPKGGKAKNNNEIGKMTFWSVAAVLNKDLDFFNYIQNIDFVGLTETWVEKKNRNNLINNIQ